MLLPLLEILRQVHHQQLQLLKLQLLYLRPLLLKLLLLCLRPLPLMLPGLFRRPPIAVLCRTPLRCLQGGLATSVLNNLRINAFERKVKLEFYFACFRIHQLEFPSACQMFTLKMLWRWRFKPIYSVEPVPTLSNSVILSIAVVMIHTECAWTMLWMDCSENIVSVHSL